MYKSFFPFSMAWGFMDLKRCLRSIVDMWRGSAQTLRIEAKSVENPIPGSPVDEGYGGSRPESVYDFDSSDTEESEVDNRQVVMVRSGCRRGTRGSGRVINYNNFQQDFIRPFNKAKVLYCSLTEVVVRRALDIEWIPTLTNLRALKEEVLYHHKRNGCDVVWKSGVHANLSPGEQTEWVMEWVAANVTLSSPTLTGYAELRQRRLREEYGLAWEAYYLSVDNTLGLGLQRRFTIWWRKLRLRLLGSAPLPPRC